MAISTTDPRTGKVIRSFPPLRHEELDDRLERAATSAAAYRLTTYEQRARWLRSAADILETRIEAIARLMTLEMGKTRTSAVAEVTKCATCLRFYAEHGAAFLADNPVYDPSAVNATAAYGRYLPLGVVLAVMPWNFPFWQAIRFAAPALMAGNVGLLKHASNVPQTALALEELFRDSEFPDDVFQTLLVNSDAVAHIVSDNRVAAVTLTGSEAAGASVARAAGGALKKVVLELGGSDPFIVMPSADLAVAADIATTARCQNNGQSCIAAKRFLVHQEVYDEWLDLFTTRMAALEVGDPMKDNIAIGPLATEAGRDQVTEQVQAAVRAGAKVLLGGFVPDQPGWWYPPTIITGITSDMSIYHEEVFGPVASVYRVSSVAEAVDLANATRFGLGASVWTNDPTEREVFIQDIQAGQTFVNGMTTSYPALPFGGIKASGYGRELAAAGIREFTNLKTVWIA